MQFSCEHNQSHLVAVLAYTQQKHIANANAIYDDLKSTIMIICVCKKWCARKKFQQSAKTVEKIGISMEYNAKHPHLIKHTCSEDEAKTPLFMMMLRIVPLRNTMYYCFSFFSPLCSSPGIVFSSTFHLKRNGQFNSHSNDQYART